MPIRIPDDLPAAEILEGENIFVMTEKRAMQQDIRPLRILLLNLMPNKVETETQILRKLSNTPLQVEVDFLQTDTHEATHAPEGHMGKFYMHLDDVRDSYYDGMIVTGAPVEKMEFEDVDYWSELCEIFDWAEKHVFSTYYICWGAQAGLYYHFGVGKRMLEKKLSGVYPHRIVKRSSPLVRGVDDVMYVPHSRYTAVEAKDIEACADLEMVAVSEEAGVSIVKSTDSRHFFVLGHLEYDRTTLSKEYARDLEKGIAPDIPEHYFPDDDPTKDPVNRWRSSAQLIYTNWLNYYVYQATPYDLSTLHESQ